MTHAPRAAPLFSRVGLALALASLLGCGGDPPRFGVLEVSAEAPRATLSGRTSAEGRPSLELSPGCPGFIDPSTPEHLVHVTGGAPLFVSVASPEGPLALAVAGGGEVRCDSDGGSGHVPRVLLDAAGDYRVYVGALERPSALRYQLVVTPGAEGPGAGGSSVGGEVRVSVTITSDPPGASIESPEGEHLGTTPAMLALAVPAAEVGRERRFVLRLAGRREAQVGARLVGGAVALHATLPLVPVIPDVPDAGGVPAVTGELVATTSDAPLSIQDFTTVEQHADVASDCVIERAAVALDLQHSYVADLRVVLRAPSGTEIVLHNQQSGSRRALVTTIDWDDRRGALRRLAGQNARGRWTLLVSDSVATETGVLSRFSIRFTCASRFGGSGPARPLPPSRPRPPPQLAVPPGMSLVPAPPSNRVRPARPGDGLVDPWGAYRP